MKNDCVVGRRPGMTDLREPLFPTPHTLILSPKVVFNFKQIDCKVGRRPDLADLRRTLSSEEAAALNLGSKVSSCSALCEVRWGT